MGLARLGWLERGTLRLAISGIPRIQTWYLQAHLFALQAVTNDGNLRISVTEMPVVREEPCHPIRIGSTEPIQIGPHLVQEEIP